MLHLKIFPLLYAMIYLAGNGVKLHGVDKREAHPFYVSVTEVVQNKRTNILEVSTRIFTDDFEKTLRMHYKEKIDLLQPADIKVMDKVINDYVNKRLSITVDGKKTALHYVGYEQIEDAIQCYFQINNSAVQKKISVFNNLLFEYMPQQSNIVHVTVNNTRKSAQLINPDASVHFEF